MARYPRELYHHKWLSSCWSTLVVRGVEEVLSKAASMSLWAPSNIFTTYMQNMYHSSRGCRASCHCRSSGSFFSASKPADCEIVQTSTHVSYTNKHDSTLTENIPIRGTKWYRTSTHTFNCAVLPGVLGDPPDSKECVHTWISVKENAHTIKHWKYYSPTSNKHVHMYVAFTIILWSGFT